MPFTLVSSISTASITLSAVQSTSFQSGAPPSVRQNLPSPENAMLAIVREPRSGKASIFRRLRDVVSYKFTAAQDLSARPASATARRRRLDVSASAVIPADSVPPISWERRGEARHCKYVVEIHPRVTLITNAARKRCSRREQNTTRQ